MEKQEIIVRMADIRDAQEMLDIYVPYVRETAITFEYEPPGVEEFAGRIQKTLEKYPWLAADDGGRIAGYCYVSPFKEREAYDWAVETTVYLRPEYKGRGIGRRLYEKLEEILKEQHILNLNACIAYPHPESIAFHEKMGYKMNAHFHNCGYKLGAWYDMVWMEKLPGKYPAHPLPVIPVGEVNTEKILKSKKTINI